MAQISDLNFDDLQELGLPEGTVFITEDPNGVTGYCLSVSALSGETVDTPELEGVVRFAMKLIDACSKVQAQLNVPQVVGEKLAAFPPPVTDGSIIDGYVSTSVTVAARVDLGSASRIVGAIE